MKKKNAISLLALSAMFLSACGVFELPSSSGTSSKSEELTSSSENPASSESSTGSSQSTSSSIQEPEPPQRVPYTKSDYAINGHLSEEGFRKMFKDSMRFAEKEMEEGTVLLKNNNNALPLSTNEKISLFGSGSKNTYYRSGSSTAAPNDGLVVNMYDAFTKGGFEVNKTLWDAIPAVSNHQVIRAGVSTEPTTSYLNEDVKSTFSDYRDVAIVTITRGATENSDPSISSKALDLTVAETNLLTSVRESGVFSKIVVILNTPMPISVGEFDKELYGIDSIVWIGSPGLYGLGGVVNAMKGDVDMSGHLPYTFAASVASSPAVVNSGYNSLAVFQEGIYTGYKYYETRYEDSMLNRGNAVSPVGATQISNAWAYNCEVSYPFGYGLSYTTFKHSLNSVKYNEEEDAFHIVAEVKNTGNRVGNPSIQLYFQSPYTNYDKENKIEKSAISLLSYDKINDLKPGESSSVEFVVDRYHLATYDNVGYKSYIIEGGDYYFTVADDVHEAMNTIIASKNPGAALLDHQGLMFEPNEHASAKKVTLSEDYQTFRCSRVNPEMEVTNRFDDADYNYYAAKNDKASIEYLSRSDWEATYPTKIVSASPATNNDLNMSILASKPYGESIEDGVSVSDYCNDPFILKGEETTIKFSDMADIPLTGTIKEGKFKGLDAEEVWDGFVKQMDMDELASGISDARGVRSNEKIGMPGFAYMPAAEGITTRYRFGGRKWAMNFAGTNVAAASFSQKTQKELASFMAEQAIWCGVPLIEGPQATPFRCAYASNPFSTMTEDAMFNYRFATNLTKGTLAKGVAMSIGGFALYTQETGRQRIQAYCNEQTLRETYLRPFEGAVVEGKSLFIKTSYNRIGTTYAACHENLINEVLRGEWGFEGMTSNDPLTGSNTDTYSNGPAMLRFGTDLFGLDGQRGNQLKTYIEVNNDVNLLRYLQRANKRILYVLSRTFLSTSVENESTNIIDSQYLLNLAAPNNRAVVEQSIASFNYDFNPRDVVVKEQETWDYDSVASMPFDREGVNRVYEFDGGYSEGYQGDYSEYLSYLRLWEDGIATAKMNSTIVKGYWYNSSLEAQDNAKDCLVVVYKDNRGLERSMVMQESSGINTFTTREYFMPGWGDGRTVTLNGHYYYPDVAILPIVEDYRAFHVGDTFKSDSISVYRINSNGEASNILRPAEVTYTLPSEMAESNKLIAEGTFNVLVTWNGFSQTIQITVS